MSKQLSQDEIQKELNKVLPFKWRIQSESYSYDDRFNIATCIPYLDSRVIIKKLNDVFGYGKWTEEHYSVNNSTYCKIGIWNEEIKAFVFKSDAGETKRDVLVSQFLELFSNPEKFLPIAGLMPKDPKKPLTDLQVYQKMMNKISNELENSSKAESTDSFKRACVKLGIGVYLYSLGEQTIFVKDFDVVNQAKEVLFQKKDSKKLNEYCNSICNIPVELISEVKESTDPQELSEIWFRMSNLHKNKNFRELIQLAKKVLAKEADKQQFEDYIKTI